METFEKKLNKRLKVILIFLLFTFIFICFFLYKLQITSYRFYNDLSQKNFQRYEKITSFRGNITDTFGNLLATNKQINNVWWQGTGKKVLDEQQESQIKKLKNILNLTEKLTEEIKYAENKSIKICVAKDISLKKLSEIIEEFGQNENIKYETSLNRYYPYESLACHILGYVSMQDENSGKMGLELIYDSKLKGSAGKLIKIINSRGNLIGSEELIKSSPGQSIKTTINLDLQIILEQIFPKEDSGACILFNPQNGAIEALVSRPNFNPNIFIKKIDPDTWKNIQENKCFLNRAFNACYPPASLFKLVTISAAIEEGLINQNSRWNCLGNIFYANRFILCGKREGHGNIDIKDAVAFSCNIPFYEIGQKISIDTLADYAFKLGLGKKTNIIFNEQEGLIPTRQWKWENKADEWWQGETLSVCIGQSYLLVTPIQVAHTISGICKGYFVQPRILEECRIIKKKLKIDPKTRKILRDSMKSVTTKGTARSLNKLLNFTIFSKTGTAQTQTLCKKKFEKKHSAHAWFIGYFQYKNYEPKTIVILIENAGSTFKAINLASLFFSKYAKYIESQKLKTNQY